MTTEEYNKEYKILNEKIISLERQKMELIKSQRELSENYIEEHREFHNGDLVNVTHGFRPKTEKAFIASASEYNGKINYKFIQVKKDGKPSARRLYVDYWDEKTIKIELINTDYRNKNWDGTEIVIETTNTDAL